MEEMEFIPGSHRWLTNLAKRLGYRGKNTQLKWEEGEGFCFGVAHMAKQALLVGDLETFCQRFANLAQLTPDTLAHIEKLIQEDVAWSKIKEATGVDLVDVYAFLDGVEIYHAAHKYPYLFEKPPIPQAAEISAPLVSPSLLENSIAQVSGFSGAYSHDNLKIYLEMLRKIYEEEDFPFSLILRSSNHTIHIHYDKASKKWMLIDANQLPIIKQDLDTDEEMATEIAEAFLNDFKQGAIFSTEVYTKKNHSKQLARKFLDTMNEDKWQEIHKPMDLNQGNQKDAWNGTWLLMAARNGYQEEVKTLLLNKEINPDQPEKLNDVTPLMLAVQNNHTKVAELLLDDERVNPFRASKERITPFFTALCDGHAEIANLFLKKLDNFKFPLDVVVENDGLLAFKNAVKKYEANLAIIKKELNDYLKLKKVGNIDTTAIKEKLAALTEKKFLYNELAFQMDLLTKQPALLSLETTSSREGILRDTLKFIETMMDPNSDNQIKMEAWETYRTQTKEALPDDNIREKTFSGLLNCLTTHLGEEPSPLILGSFFTKKEAESVETKSSESVSKFGSNS